MLDSKLKGQGKIKKLRTGAVVSALAVSIASLSHTVGAEEVAPKPVNVEAPKAEVVETTTPAVATKEEVATKEAEAKKADQKVVEAKQAVKDAKRATNEADSLVNEKTEAVKKAEDFAKKASPAVIAEAEKEVVKAESAVPVKEEAVKQAEAKATEATKAVSAQEAVVAEKEATQATKEKALTSATEAVQIATDALNGKGLENAKEAQKEAVEAERTSKQAQIVAETALTEAEEANQATRAQIEGTKADIATKTQAVSDAKAHQEQAEQAVSTATQAVVDAKANLTRYTTGSIVLKSDMVDVIKEKIQLKNYYFSIPRNKLTKEDVEKYNAKNKELRDKITSLIGDNIASKSYTPTASELADKTQYDVNNLPKEVRDDLTLFAADLISNLREQLGLTDVVVTKDSFEFAEKVAKEYIKGGWSWAMSEDYESRGGRGHYAKGIHAVADAYGLNGVHPTEEELNKGIQAYENSVIRSLPPTGGLTKADMKSTLFESVADLVSNEHDYGHLSGTLVFDEPDETVYSGGFAQSISNDAYTNHFITHITESSVKGSTFNTTELENPYTTARKNRAQAEALVAEKEQLKSQAEETLKTLLLGIQAYENSVIRSLPPTGGLTKADMKSTLFESVADLVSNEHDYGHLSGTLVFDEPDETVYSGGFAQSISNDAYTNHFITHITESSVKGSTFNTTELENPYTTARKNRAQAEALVAEKEQLKSQAEETLKTANQTVAEAETALQSANSNLKAQEAQLKDTVALKQALQSATTTHNQAVVTLSNANALVATLSATKADKEAKLAELKATAKQAEKELNQAKEETKAEKATLSSLQEKAEEATQAVSVAKEALDQAKAQVVSSKELVQELKVAAKELETRKAELKDAEEALKEAKANQATAQEALEAKEKVAKEANKVYATAKASYEAEQARLQAEELKKHPVTEKGIPEVRPALPEFVLPTTPSVPSVPSVPVAPVVPVVPTTPRVEVPVVNNNGGVVGQDKAKVDVVAKQKTETKTTKDSQAGKWIESAGRWWYQHEDGSYTSNGWEQIKGTWYYFDNTGWMQTGWVKTGGSWYYLTETGSLATGWVKDNGTWYYLKENGKMATGWVKDNDTWYYLDSAGAMKTGWFTVSGKWYYAYSSGALAVNTTTPDGYTVNGNGEWV